MRRDSACRLSPSTSWLRRRDERAFSRVRIDAQLKDQGWDVANSNSVRFEYPLSDGTRADYVLCDRNGRSLAVVEAQRASIAWRCSIESKPNG